RRRPRRSPTSSTARRADHVHVRFPGYVRRHLFAQLRGLRRRHLHLPMRRRNSLRRVRRLQRWHQRLRRGPRSMILQIIILVTSCISIALMAQTSATARWWGFNVGLLGQPAWLLLAWNTQLWAVLLVALWWAYWYVRGSIAHWPRRSRSPLL